jgi:hypothetical protein
MEIIKCLFLLVFISFTGHAGMAPVQSNGNANDQGLVFPAMLGVDTYNLVVNLPLNIAQKNAIIRLITPIYAHEWGSRAERDAAVDALRGLDMNMRIQLKAALQADNPL